MRLLHSELDLVVKSGFVYVPLLLDPAIAGEIQDQSESEGQPKGAGFGNLEAVINRDGKLFVRSVSIQSLLTNYERIDRSTYDQLKRDHLGKHADFNELAAISPKGKLQTIVLGIMPYFIRKSGGFERRRYHDGELLELISNKIDLPRRCLDLAEKVLDPDHLQRRFNELNELDLTLGPLQEGRATARVLQSWLLDALRVHIVNREKVRLRRELRERERISDSKRKHIATLLYLTEKGSLEVDGFGFSRIGSRDDYVIYKHTGEYILKDYYARSYRFPDCRVAVSTAGPLRPIVLESYKHPFLVGHAPKQEICISGYNWPDEFTAPNVIRVMEEGINALLYGYDARRRNGYHSLDPTLYYAKTIEFVDYRV